MYRTSQQSAEVTTAKDEAVIKAKENNGLDKSLTSDPISRVSFFFSAISISQAQHILIMSIITER